ncbi:MAG: hypothetical protein GX987_07640 [Tissierellia bacterium]|nr:hypothetical protein [Tissierellia bacterium]
MANLNGRVLYDKYEEYIRGVTPQEVFYSFIEEGMRPEEKTSAKGRGITRI